MIQHTTEGLERAYNFFCNLGRKVIVAARRSIVGGTASIQHVEQRRVPDWAQATAVRQQGAGTTNETPGLVSPWADRHDANTEGGSETRPGKIRIIRYGYGLASAAIGRAAKVSSLQM